MSIYILHWIKEDLEKQGQTLNGYKLIEIKDMITDYNNKFILKGQFIIMENLYYKDIKKRYCNQNRHKNATNKKKVNYK